MSVSSSARSALEIVDSLISHVERLSVSSAAPAVNVNANAPAKSASQPQASAASSRSLPISTSDAAWQPLVPVGHTPFSWYGDAETENQNKETIKTQTNNQQTADNAAPAAKSKAAKPSAPVSSGSSSQPVFTRLDIRVGHVVSARKHPEADKLYIEQIDVGEPQPREIVSGLVQFVPLAELENSLVLVICNLKPAPLKGVKSFGMVLAAANEDRSAVELVRPPAGAKAGDRIVIDGLDFKSNGPDAQIDPKKANNCWDAIKPLLRVNADGVATFDGQTLRPSLIQGTCNVKSIRNAPIS